MAVTTAVSMQVASVEERTWRATVETPKGQPYYLDLHREKRNLDAQGNQVGDKVIVPPIHLLFNDIVNETVTIPVNGVNTTLKVSDLCTFLVAYFDQKATSLSE